MLSMFTYSHPRLGQIMKEGNEKANFESTIFCCVCFIRGTKVGLKCSPRETRSCFAMVTKQYTAPFRPAFPLFPFFTHSHSPLYSSQALIL